MASKWAVNNLITPIACFATEILQNCHLPSENLSTALPSVAHLGFNSITMLPAPTPRSLPFHRGVRRPLTKLAVRADNSHRPLLT